MKIAIIGTGAAAFGVVHGVLESAPAAEITLFDPAGIPSTPPSPETSSPEDISRLYDNVYRELKREYGYRFPPLKSHFTEHLDRYPVNGKPRLWRSELLGGLTNYWGGTMLPFRDEETGSWPIDSAMLAPHYARVAELVGISGCQDGLNSAFVDDYANRPAIRIPAGLQALSQRINDSREETAYSLHSGVNRVALETRSDRDTQCVYCGECMAGCFTGSVFSSRGFFQKLLSEGSAHLVTGRVSRIDPVTRTVHMSDEHDGESHAGFDKIFLCAGAIGTGELVMRSLGIEEGPVLLDNAVYQFPILNLSVERSDHDKSRYLALSNLLVECLPRTEGLSTQIQIYPNFDYLWRNVVPESIWPLFRPLSRALRDRLVWARMFVHSDHSYAYSIRLKGEQPLEFEEIRAPQPEQQATVLASIKRVINGNGFYVPPIPPVVSKTSSHMAGTVPYGSGLVDLRQDNELSPGVFVCDSSCFPESPASSPTFPIMANAHRVAVQALA